MRSLYLKLNRKLQISKLLNFNFSKSNFLKIYEFINNKDYNIKDMYIQDRVNTTNNVDKTASDWSKSTTSNEMEIKFTRDDTDNYK